MCLIMQPNFVICSLGCLHLMHLIQTCLHITVILLSSCSSTVKTVLVCSEVASVIIFSLHVALCCTNCKEVSFSLPGAQPDVLLGTNQTHLD